MEGGQGALYVCLVCMPYIYGSAYKGTYKGRYHTPEAGGRTVGPYMYVLYVCRIYMGAHIRAHIRTHIYLKLELEGR